MKKYIGFLSVIVNCMLITGLLVHAFTLSSAKDASNANEKEYVYIETTTIKEESEPEEIDNIQERITNKSDKANSSKLNDNKYIEKTTTVTKSTYSSNSKNNTVNNSQNSTETNTTTNNNQQVNNTNTNTNSNKNDNINNNNYVVEYTDSSYCGFCAKKLNNNDGICEDCRTIRSKLGE